MEVSALFAEMNVVWNQLSTIENENATLLKIGEVEAPQGTKQHKSNSRMEELHVASWKDYEKGRL